MVTWGGTIEGAGTLYQLINPKDGTKVTAMGAVLEAFQKGTPEQQQDAIGEVVQAAGTHYVCEMFGLDGWLGQMAVMMAMKVVSNYVAEMAGEMLGLDPDAEVGDKEVDAARQRAMDNAADAAKAGVGFGVGAAGVAASTNQEQLNNLGLSAPAVTPDRAAILEQSGLAIGAGNTAKREYIDGRIAALQNKPGEGAYLSTEERRRIAGEEYDQAFGAEPQRLMTADEYVQQNMTNDISVTYSRTGRATIHNYDDTKDQEAFLRAEYKTKLAATTHNMERMQQGLEPLSQEELMAQFAPAQATFEEKFDGLGQGGLPLTQDAQGVMASNGLTVDVDMKEYRKLYVNTRAETLQNSPGAGEYLSLSERKRMAGEEFDAKYPEGTSLQRVMTRAEYVAQNQEEKLDVTFSKTGNIHMHNTQNVDEEKAFLEADYEARLKIAQEQVANPELRPKAPVYAEAGQGTQMSDCVENGREEIMAAGAGLATFNVADALGDNLVEQDSTRIEVVNEVNIPTNVDAQKIAASVQTGLGMSEDSTVADFAAMNGNDIIDTQEEAVALQSFKTKVPGIQIDACAQESIDQKLAEAGLTGNGISDIASQFIEGDFELSDIAQVAMNVFEKQGAGMSV